jgi:NEDD8-activating enzyme E1
VVKNIIPAIASTNAIVAAACTLECLKIVTLCCRGLNNYMLYAGKCGGPHTSLQHAHFPFCFH